MKNLLNFYIIFSLLSFLYSQTGKINGYVEDSSTGEPLIGVSIILIDQGIGADTDENGRYTIINVPIGIYDLKTSIIGYSTVKVTGLIVSTDRSTEQNFSLIQKTIEGEEITVLADRPLIYKDLTSTQKITTSEDILNMPVESILGVLTTQAGVNVGAGGELHIRGGRSNEVGYFIDGVSVSNPFFYKQFICQCIK